MISLKRPYKQRVQKWLHALRSGKYKQGFYRLLSKDHKFCCLGVACDVSKLDSWDEKSYLSQAFKLPDLVRKYYGLRDLDELPSKLNFFRLNDTEQFTFDEIADIIEQNESFFLPEVLTTTHERRKAQSTPSRRKKKNPKSR